MFYLASDLELPLVPPSDGSISVTKLDPEDAVVRRQMDMPHVAYVGSHEGCGCGFLYEPEACPEDGPAVLKSLGQLADYVERQAAQGSRIQLYAAWDGEQGEGTPVRRKVPVEAIRFGEYYLECGELLDIEVGV